MARALARRVAVVGGGIAGSTAAWALERAGVEVELFESEPTLGGNAKTHTWTLDEGRDHARELTTGLSVLAWPERVFRNYTALLDELDIESKTVDLRFFIRSGDQTWEAGEGPLVRRYAEDLRRWRELVAFIARINHVFEGRPSWPSMYRMAPLNPMNLIPLWTLARWFGVSRGFWEDVVVSIHSSTFLTTRLDGLPAVIAPTIDAIVPLDGPAKMRTWASDSRIVFQRLVASFAERVHCSSAITRIEHSGDGGVTLGDEHGRSHSFDAAVFACPASATYAALQRRRPLHELLLRGIAYVDDNDDTFMQGRVHSDPSVIPPSERAQVLGEFCNYVTVHREGGSRPRYTNHFVLSSWVPSARGQGMPMLVSYDGREPEPGQRVISNRRAHPDLNTANLLRALLYRFMQGRDNLYYCGSYATPGNGHDLSLLSGLVVANQLGADYPFEKAGTETREDFRLLRRMMLGRWR